MMSVVLVFKSLTGQLMKKGMRFKALLLPLTVCCSTVGLLAGCDAGGTNSGNIAYQKSVAVLNQKAQGYLGSGQATLAISRLESALELVPDQIETMYNLAIAYHSAERYEEAAALYQKLVTLRPAQAGIYHKSAGVALEAHADGIVRKAKDFLSGSDYKAKQQQADADAKLNYQHAIEQYQLALSDLSEKDGKGLAQQERAGLENQVKLLQERVAAL